MLSGIFEFFGGSSSSDKSKNIEEHIVPIPQHTGRPLTHTDCFTWLNQKVVILLRRFDNPQLGVVKYIGSDDRGKLCAGIEFDYDVGGMNGKVAGQKLFKCRPGHGLLIPVEFVRLLVDYEDGRNIFPSPPASAPRSNSTSSSQNVFQASSVPNLNGGANNGNIISIPFEDYTPLTLPGLKTGDNVVWLGGTTPQTGIVRWIGRAGKGVNIPIKIWMEMDDYVGFGLTEIDVGTKFGCASGRGKLLPADELILLENFLPDEVPCRDSETTTPSSAVERLPCPPSSVVVPAPAVNKPSLYPSVPTHIYATLDNHVDRNNARPNPTPESTTSTMKEGQPGVDNDLIDFSDGSSRKSDDLKITPEGNTVADLDFFRVMNEEPMDTDEGCCDGLNSLTNTLETESSIAATDEFEFEFVASAPPVSLPDESPNELKASATTPATNLQSPENKTDVNGNESEVETKSTAVVHQNGFVIPEKVLAKLVDDSVQDYLPPFIVPPIDIVEFFRAEGLKGIQGRRNSCYIDVVLFSMFAFTDVFDPYFIVKTGQFNKVPDSPLTKTAKKILAEQIVNPLRQSYYVGATGVNELRDLMIPFSDKLDGAFLDIEEFMLIMFDKVFQLKEFILYDNGVKDYLHQVNLGDHVLPPVITLKQCLDLSLKDYNLKLQSLPRPAFIIQIPRNHTGIIQSTTIVPNLSLNMDSLTVTNPTGATSAISTLMNLVAVICINDFHFVTFVKCGKGPLSHWVMFDSNPSEERPKVEIVTNMGECLESLEHQVLTNPANVAETKHKLPPLVQRLLSDIYVCIYCPAENMA